MGHARLRPLTRLCGRSAVPALAGVQRTLVTGTYEEQTAGWQEKKSLDCVVEIPCILLKNADTVRFTASGSKLIADNCTVYYVLMGYRPVKGWGTDRQLDYRLSRHFPSLTRVDSRVAH